MSTRRNRLSRILVCTAAAGLLLAGAAIAGDWLAKENPQAGARGAFWTPARYAAARPLPGARALTSEEIAAAAADFAGGDEAAAVESVAGAAPLLRTSELATRLYEPRGETREATITAPASGTAKQPFTSAPLVPISADQSYPYMTVGRFYLTIGSSTFYCSAAAIRPRLVITAGSCVHQGTGGSAGFYDNFQFVPAFRDGAAPFGTWDYNYVVVSTTWSAGGGRLPNAADYALLEMDDQTVGGVLHRLGEVTGYLGYQTLALKSNHVHILGYTTIFDNGTRIHQVTSGSPKAAGQNTMQYGGDLRGGSPGGPWIQNFGPNAAAARIVGVTSYYPSALGVNYIGASIPDSRFTSLLANACGHSGGNC